MKFVDRAKIFIKSGNGGNGCVSFRRERNVEEGGPDGGDGGRGGNVSFFVDENKETLIDFSSTVHFKAPHGENGMGAKCFGKFGNDLVLRIPRGTQIWNSTKEILFFDATENGKEFVLFKGGKGGVGNARFVSSTNQVPKKATVGEVGQEGWVWLVLKLFADIGYVGFPNAGKSSLLTMLTNSRSKVANYPFTTLKPELGALWHNDKKLLMADLPGIIQGAHSNKGLGLEFLGHVERCRAIMHIIDVSLLNSLNALDAMLYEIEQFSPKLLEKQQIIILNKTDLVDADLVKLEVELIRSKYNYLVIPISCLNKTGVENITEVLFNLMAEKTPE